MIIRRKQKSRERGQVLVLCALSMFVLLLFVGLAVDFGMAYVTKARLGKAVDAAALSGAKALYLGQTQATAVAQSAFAMNYKSSIDASAPVVNVTYTPDASGNTLMSVNSTATINTFFIRLLPAYQTLPVSASAQATRARVIMTLVLDTSGSMQGNGGWSALPPAVSEFISLFDDTLDSVAVVTFASTVKVAFPMQTGNFKAAIQTMTAAMTKSTFTGSTFSDGGLQQAIIQNNSLTLPGNVVKVVVFFTDGHANTIQDTLNCATATVPDGLWNYGGHDTPEITYVSFINPTSAKTACTEIGDTHCCPISFPSHQTGMLETINWSNISSIGAEAEFRAVADSNVMRSSPNNTIVYAIGLGNVINKPFLYQVANDPNSSTYDPTKLVGEADFAPAPSDLAAIFEKLANKILLRLTQ
jgi:Flp pilus assembly protein TadG